jgi:hypothetical protein
MFGGEPAGWAASAKGPKAVLIARKKKEIVFVAMRVAWTKPDSVRDLSICRFLKDLPGKPYSPQRKHDPLVPLIPNEVCLNKQFVSFSAQLSKT